ncbi:achaete-scute homolog 3 [Bemisia tabaci]|uniref:achaete-scute homolog 3 n=1 Tax=Bemisia tabaci TaxID=7038 RepID=UPI003B28B795
MEKKPALQIIAKRNARERRRVQAVNGAFAKLRKTIPADSHRGKRISKVKTLKMAIYYIKMLDQVLRYEVSLEQNERISVSNQVDHPTMT